MASQFRSTLRSITKSALDWIGLLRPARAARRWVSERQYQHYYRQRGLYKVQIYGREVVFSTEDRYSGRWFFPRYDGRIHEPKATELFTRLAQDAEHIFDIGANLGWFTCISASFSDGTIHAFDLDEDNLRRLSTNVSLNGLENVKVRHNAVADSDGHVSYQKKTESACVGYSFMRHDRNKRDQIQVEATTIDRYVEEECQSVDLIKIDVEGAEKNVLEGGQRAMREFRPHILLEIHPPLLESANTSVQQVLGTLPNSYRIYLLRNFRWGGERCRQPVDPSTFSPNRVSMLYAEPASNPLNTFPTPTGTLYEVCENN